MASWRSSLQRYVNGAGLRLALLCGVLLASCGGDDDTGLPGHGGAAGHGPTAGEAGSGRAGTPAGGSGGVGRAGQGQAGSRVAGKGGTAGSETNEEGGGEGGATGFAGEAGETSAGMAGDSGASGSGGTIALGGSSGTGGGMAGSSSGTGAAAGTGTGGSGTAGVAGTANVGGTAGVGGSGGTANVDACTGVTCSGHGVCTTAGGVASCTCDAGFVTDPGDVTACNDVNECALNNGGCDPRATCTNLPGSYACGACPPAYTGTGAGGCIPIKCTGAPDATCACVKVSPDGDDALASTSGGLLPFASVSAAIDFAASHATAPHDLCVAEGTACGMLAVYPGPNGSDLALRDGVSLYGGYESATWSRCGDLGTTLAPGTGNGVTFDPTVASTTVLDGFAIARFPSDTTAAITVDGAQGAVVSNVEVGAQVDGPTTTYGIDLKNGAYATLSGITMQPGYLAGGPQAQVGIRAVSSKILMTNSTIGLGWRDSLTTTGLVLQDSEGSEVRESSFTFNFANSASGIVAVNAPGLVLDGTTFSTGNVDGVLSVVTTADFQGVPDLSWIGGGISARGGGTMTSGISLADSPGAKLDADVSLQRDFTNGIYLTGDATGTVLDGSVTGTGAAYGAGVTIDGCAAASPLIRTAVSVQAAPLIGEAISVAGDCSPTISATADVRIWSASVPGYPQQSMTAIHCRTPSLCTIDHSQATITGGITPYGSFLQTWGIACDSGACPTIVDSAATGLSAVWEHRTAFYSGGGISAPGATLVSRNTASALCTGGNGVGLLASGRIENNVITGPTCGAAYVGLLDRGSFTTFDREVGLEVAGSAVVHSNSIDGGSVNDCLASLCAPEPSHRVVGAVDPGDSRFLNNIIQGGTGALLLGQESGSADSLLHNDLSGGVLVAVGTTTTLVPTTTITTSLGVNTLAGASGNFSGGSIIDAGTTLDAPPTDKNGVPRDASPDVGPYEATGAPSACLGFGCSDHGVCQFLGGSGGCVCDGIYAGDHCERGYQMIANGDSMLTAVVGDQTLRAWGASVVNVPPGTFTAIDGSTWDTVCGVETGGQARCWNPWGSSSITPTDDTFVSVTPGSSFGCGLHGDGTVACFGSSSDGATTPPAATSFSALSAGFYHVCGIESPGGAVSCWGRNDVGQASPPSDAFDALDATYNRTCGIRSADGSIVCWGVSGFGGATIPDGPFTALSLSEYYGCAIKSDRSLVCWGYTPAGSPPSGEYDLIATAHYYACAHRTDGVVTCWGSMSTGASGPP